MGKRKPIILVLGFLLISAPGAVDSWLSLFETMSVAFLADIYQLFFPVLGLLVLLFGLWWTRPKKEGTVTASYDSSERHVYLFLHPIYIHGLGTEQEMIDYSYVKVMAIDCSDVPLIIDAASITITNIQRKDIGASAPAIDTPFTIDPRTGKAIYFRVNFTDPQLRLIEPFRRNSSVLIEASLSISIRGRGTALTIPQMAPGEFYYPDF
jgi:hypothetical protein